MRPDRFEYTIRVLSVHCFPPDRNWNALIKLSISVCVAMAMRHTIDRQHPSYKEGKRKLLESKQDHLIAEAERAVEERKRARSGGGPPCGSTSDGARRGKPRGRRGGRRGGRRKASATGRYDLHQPLYVCQTCQQQRTPDMKHFLQSGYWPASLNTSTLYTLDLLSSFQELKVISPGFSRQAFAKLLEHRTKCGGRSGHIKGDTLQRSFLEFSYASFEKDQLCCGAVFTCTACTPEMLAVSVDGNRKLYRFRRNGSSGDHAFFEGLFVAEDSAVSGFVDMIQKAVKKTQGRGTCGDSQWTAARETSRRASKLDEEGMEVAVCRHGFLLKALNMYRGEIFAYPMYLQKELMPAKAQFFAMDVACKYWPYLEKVASVLPALQELTTMKPFLSVMHARAHATKCEIKWSGRNQEGAGTTAGEEVEQVNSYLSRCALTTKYMSKADLSEAPG
ncbi:uncharacterized protein LOC115556645 isoform X2 [Gadus morhua]|uniref:uncharacterized protein LOC115556645 isoform X2 n=1 Tax=Gadus morhua TaxID=8049 RepID=UPI0011B6FA10|nr:uncharacterized protein LOC115556645 isoform X2 [Gadus morhua]